MFKIEEKVTIYLTSVNGSDSLNGFKFPSVLGLYEMKLVHKVEDNIAPVISEGKSWFLETDWIKSNLLEWNKISFEVTAPPLKYFESVAYIKNSGFENGISFNFVSEIQLDNDHLIYFELPSLYDNIFQYYDDTVLVRALTPMEMFSESIGNKCKFYLNIINFMLITRWSRTCQPIGINQTRGQY